MRGCRCAARHGWPRRQKYEELGFSNARGLSGERAIRFMQGDGTLREHRQATDFIGESLSNEFFCTLVCACWILPTVVFFRQRRTRLNRLFIRRTVPECLPSLAPQ